MENAGSRLHVRVAHLKKIVETIGGQEEMASVGAWLHPRSPLWGIWWGILLIIALIFCGQSSKFIYIDF